MDNQARPVFPPIRLPQFADEVLPPVVLAKLAHNSLPALDDIAGATKQVLLASRGLPKLAKGARVAITCGSRGIRSKPEVVKTVVAWLKERHLEPFIVPAMGSHGGARAESQTQLLAELGFTEETMGCPIGATMDVVQLGTTSQGVPVWFDKHAAGADAVIVINRIKAHTSFDREVESGLTKMVAIGLGKAEGARFVHRLGPRGYLEVLPEWARIAIENSPIVYGIGIVENTDKEAAVIEGGEPEEFYGTDARLLPVAKNQIPKLPFDPIDVLVVEELGKNISGAGMDPAVTLRPSTSVQRPAAEPYINKLVVLGLTPQTHGNGLGVGGADFTTKEVADNLDLYAMYMNSLTATSADRVRIPPVMADDKAAIQAAAGTCWRLPGEEVRLCIVRSTLHLDHAWVSPCLAAELDGAGEILSEPQTLQFDEAGRLLTTCPR